MTKRGLGVVLIAVACAAAVAATVYFGVGGRFVSPSLPDDKKPAPSARPQSDDDAPDASQYRPAPVSLSAAAAFLYDGKSPRQVGMDRAALRRRRAAVVRGQVETPDGRPLAGVEVRAQAQPEMGRTHTDADGHFDLAVNGGGPVVLSYQKRGYLPAQRQVEVPWQDYAWVPEVALTAEPGVPFDALDLPTQEAQVRVGPEVRDADGPRQAVFLAPPGFAATLLFSDGDKPLNRLALSAVETSVGPHGPEALPALPPPGAGYCYALAIGTDEALEPGAREVKFSKPLIHYVENFLKLPVGTILPLARYDGERSVWIPGPAGRVVQVVGVKDGLAELDLDGKGKPADAAALANLGVGEPERRRLAELYGKTGASVWRLPLTGLGAWAVLPALRPPDGAAAPPWPVAAVPALDPAAPREQPATEIVPIPGTPYLLCCHSDRAPGRRAAYTLEVSRSAGRRLRRR